MGLAHWPGHIAPGAVSNATVSSLDYLPTILALAGVPLPSDRSYDGVDLAPLLFGGAAKVRDFLFMSDTTDHKGNVTSVRYRNFKAYTKTYSQASCTQPAAGAVEHPDYLVFDLDADPSESTPIRPPQDVMDTIFAAHAALLNDISTTFRGNTSCVFFFLLLFRFVSLSLFPFPTPFTLSNVSVPFPSLPPTFAMQVR
jgi:hypothetical protein